MKVSLNVKLLTAVITIAFLSCSAIKQSSSNPTERLLLAIEKGHNFYSSGETFSADISLKAIFEKQSSRSSYIMSELVFEGCTFKGSISFIPEKGKKIYFEKEVIFEGCEFTETLKVNDAVFNSRLQIGGNLFRNTLDFQRNSFKSICRIDENDIGQDLSLQYSKLHENLSIFGNSIGRHLSLQGISVLGKTQLGNTTLHGSIDVSNCHFHEDFSLAYAKKGKKLLAGSSKFYSRCYIKNIEDFVSVDLSSSEILGKYKFTAKHDLIPNMENSILHRN